MTWTYGTNPSGDPKDAVRLLVGDTNEDDQLLQDEEINFFITIEGSSLKAAAASSEAIAALFSRLADESVGQVRVSFSQKSKQALDIAKNLRFKNNLVAGIPIAGGISDSDKQIQEDNDDRVRPAFRRDLHENPRTDTERDREREDGN